MANAAAVLQHGSVVGVYHKVLLPNYGVFDEDRYFAVGEDPDRVWQLEGLTAGVSICEDIWLPDGPPRQQASAGAQILLNINASPFHKGKARERETMIVDRARDSGVPVVYLNLVGGQDELVFDGCSLVVAADGTIVHRSPQFQEDHFVVDVPLGDEPATSQSLTDHLEPRLHEDVRDHGAHEDRVVADQHRMRHGSSPGEGRWGPQPPNTGSSSAARSSITKTPSSRGPTAATYRASTPARSSRASMTAVGRVTRSVTSETASPARRPP